MTVRLEVGRTYINRNGVTVRIIMRDMNARRTYIGDDGYGYTVDGRSKLSEGSGDQHRLFSEHDPT